MSDFDDKRGPDDSRDFDLSHPQEGEPVIDEEGESSIPAPGPAGDDADSGRDEDTTATGERRPDSGPGEAGEAAPPAEESLPIPLLDELEREPPVREALAPPDEEGPEAPAEAENGRRLSEQWRIDLKWIFGIPATIVLILTVAAFVLFRISGEDVSVAMIDSTREQIVDNSQFRRDLAQVDPRLLDLLESDEFAESFYKDPDLLQDLIDELPDVDAEDDPLAEKYDYIRTTLSIYDALAGIAGEEEHMQSRSALIALLLLLALFGIPYVIFSRRIGKIVSVAISLALATWIPFFLLMYLRGGLSDWIADRVDIEGDAQLQFIVNMVDATAHDLVDAAMPVYRFLSIVALILMGFGLLGLLVVWWRFEEGMTPRKKKLRDT